MLIDGWSLGIEAVYYLTFPLLMLVALRSSRAGTGLLFLLLALQAAWIHFTAGAPDGYAANAVAYHQVPAFAGYFMGGCLLGLARRAGHMPVLAPAPAIAGLLGGMVMLWLLNPQQAGDELLGWRGIASCATCFALTWVSGGLDLQRGKARIAASLGDSTYGLYLMHPLVYFGLVWVLFPRMGLQPPTQWEMGSRLVLAAAVISIAFVLAILSERYFEHPLREWSKRRARR